MLHLRNATLNEKLEEEFVWVISQNDWSKLERFDELLVLSAVLCNANWIDSKRKMFAIECNHQRVKQTPKSITQMCLTNFTPAGKWVEENNTKKRSKISHRCNSEDIFNRNTSIITANQSQLGLLINPDNFSSS